MLDVNLIMAKTEAKCRGRVCLRKLSWTGYVCKHALFRLTDQFSFQFLCCGRQTSFFLKHNYFVTENRKTKGQNDI